MNCPACKHPNSAERSFCAACGVPLVRYCSLCGFRNQIPDRFCGGCGVALDGTARLAAQAPSAPAPALAASGDADLAELLDAARDQDAGRAEDPAARVSQDDIDSLFED